MVSFNVNYLIERSVIGQYSKHPIFLNYLCKLTVGMFCVFVSYTYFLHNILLTLTKIQAHHPNSMEYCTLDARRFITSRHGPIH